jgi:pimeloyl-ACP methyl ester carboxylesterase
MATVKRPDGVELHMEARGDGPPALLVPYWSGHPAVYESLLTDLASDNTVITYDARGTGGSTRAGPYDMESDIKDLVAVLEAVGRGPVLVMAVANGSNIAVRAVAERPELAGILVSFGTAPLARATFQSTAEAGEGLVASEAVVDAFVEMVGRDYRGAMRTLLTATNPQMTEDELRERVQFQADYSPQEAAFGRLRAWVDDDPREASRRAGDRLWILTSEDVAGPWLPPPEELARLTDEFMPEARVVTVDDGPVSRPDLAAATIREAGSRLRHTIEP